MMEQQQQPQQPTTQVHSSFGFITDVQMEKYIALRVVVANLTETTNFITVFKTTHLTTKHHFYTYVFDLEKNDCTNMFAKLLIIFRIQLYGNTYRNLTKRYFTVSNKDNHYFFNHLQKLGLTVYVFNNSLNVKYIKDMTKSILETHRVLRKTVKNKTTTSFASTTQDIVAT